MRDINRVTGRQGLIAVDKIGNKILFLDPLTYKTLLTLEGFAPRVHELSLSPDHRFAYVPIYGDGKHGDNPHPGHLIAKFDLAARRHMIDLSTYPYLAPHGMRWGAAGRLYCLCENSGVLLQIDPEDGHILQVIEVGSTNAHRMEILPDGSKAYTENEEDHFCSVIDLRAHARLRDIETPNGTAGIGMSPDGKTIVYTDAKDPKLLVIDTKADEIVRTVELLGLSQSAQIARFSPDGRFLVVTSHDEPLGIIFDASLTDQQLIHLGKGPMDMGFNADGRTVLIANHDEGTLSVVDLEKAAIIKTVPAGSGVEILSFF